MTFTPTARPFSTAISWIGTDENTLGMRKKKKEKKEKKKEKKGKEGKEERKGRKEGKKEGRE